MIMQATQHAASLRARLIATTVGAARSLRSSPVLNPAALQESWRARRGHIALPEHRPHLEDAVAWLERAQNSSPDSGIARGYSLAWNPFFNATGWQPSYPETTGYIIPTLYSASRELGRPELAARALRAAHWEIAVQLSDGSVQGGVVGGATPSPAVFNTGQVMLGWMEALVSSGDPAFAEATRRAGRFLVANLDGDGHWRRGNSRFARNDATLYNARVGWALAEAGTRLDEPAFTAAASRNLRAVAAAQAENGWFPNACLYRPDRPLLHTLSYTVRGLLEGGRVLHDPSLVESAARAAEPLARMVSANGWMSGQFRADWSAAASWSCVTGQVQMANNWMRLHDITGDPRWLEPVARVIRFVKSTQNRTSRDDGVRGGIPGSAPVGAEYGRYEILSWATKYFADALMRHGAVLHGRPTSSAVSILA